MAAPSVNTSSPITYFTEFPSDDVAINALLHDVKWGSGGIGTGATVYYSFPTSNSAQLWSQFYRLNTGSEIYDDFTPFSQAQENAAIASLNAWSNVANINFIEVSTESFSSVGDIRFANSGLLSTYTYAYAYMPTLNHPVGGDIWFNTTQPISTGNDYSEGGNGYQTMMHEIGHALGLEHSFHDDPAAHEGEPELSSAYDHYQYTIMSYSDIAGRQDTGYSTYYPTTPMLYDILAIQYLYGANMTYNTGNNTYTYDDDYAYETIWDAGGTDTIEYTGDLAASINLNAGQFSSIGPSVKANRGISADAQNNIAIAYEVTIENATGGNGDDTIYGNSAANTIDGGAGNDTFVANIASSAVNNVIQRDDYFLLESDGNTDSLINIELIQFTDQTYSLETLYTQFGGLPAFSSGSNGDLTTTTPDVYSGPVDFLEYELIGSNASETVIGASTNDFINLLGGDDAASGGAGNDVLDGGTGSNFLTGDSGSDTFYLDGRSGEVTWSTITDFDGDVINIWGWIDGTSQIVLQQEDGVAGFTGATLHIDLNGDQLIDTSITLTGLEAINNMQTLQVGDNGYLFIG